VVKDPGGYVRPRHQIEETFSLERTVKGYEDLFEALIAGAVLQEPPQELEP
jgi:hypothetical protein